MPGLDRLPTVGGSIQRGKRGTGRPEGLDDAPKLAVQFSLGEPHDGGSAVGACEAELMPAHEAEQFPHLLHCQGLPGPDGAVTGSADEYPLAQVLQSVHAWRLVELVQQVAKQPYMVRFGEVGGNSVDGSVMPPELGNVIAALTQCREQGPQGLQAIWRGTKEDWGKKGLGSTCTGAGAQLDESEALVGSVLVNEQEVLAESGDDVRGGDLAQRIGFERLAPEGGIRLLPRPGGRRIAFLVVPPSHGGKAWRSCVGGQPSGAQGGHELGSNRLQMFAFDGEAHPILLGEAGALAFESACEKGFR